MIMNTEKDENDTPKKMKYSMIYSPPAKRFQKVRNPFEAALTGRLHLPTIASPSLFQRPETPQLSSTQFEWTIDEVSSLKPANVEPHETQFHDSPDPDTEAKAQSAISSFFKEQQIVPSPIDCPLRSQRILLSELNGNTPITKTVKRKKNSSSQTELTFPAVLPPELEEALRPYLQPHLAIGAENDANNQTTSIQDVKADISLRRQLFDMRSVVVIDSDGGRVPTASILETDEAIKWNSNSSPMSLTAMQQHTIAGKLSDSLDKSSFGSLSPISASDGMSFSSAFSPHLYESATKRKSRLKNMLEIEQISPIHPPARCISKGRRSLKSLINAIIQKETYREEGRTSTSEHMLGDFASSAATTSVAKTGSGSDDDNFKPDRSSSPMRVENAESTKIMINDNDNENSFNLHISRIAVNGEEQSRSLTRSPTSRAELISNTTSEMFEDDELMEDMQVSQLSTHSSNSSRSALSLDTPTCSNRRSASRKNLSQSFSANWSDDEDDEEEANKCISVVKTKDCSTTQVSDAVKLTARQELLQVKERATVNAQKQPSLASATCSSFYRVDSGFNEMTTSSSSSSAFHTDEHSREAIATASMVSCSTPSKRSLVVTSFLN